LPVGKRNANNEQIEGRFRETVMANTDLVDQVYECSLLPELWPAALDALAAIAEARGGTLCYTASSNNLTWTASETLCCGMRRLAKGDMLTRSERHSRLHTASHPGFLTEHDIYGEDELNNDPFYYDMLWPAGLGWAAATAVPLPTGGKVIIAVERNYARGPVEPSVIAQLDALRPHLARSAFLSAQLQLERARIASQTLSLVGLPALVFDQHGAVLAANSLIEALHGHIVWRAQDRIVFKDQNSDWLFQRAIATIDLPDMVSARSFPVRGNDTQAAMVAHVIPIRGNARDLFVQCTGVLVMTPISLPKAPPIELIQSLFDLTPAEARVARSLVAGETVEEIASASGVSNNTVRSQVRGVLEKTGCRRQAEVVALLGNVGGTVA
jgi:DNA-binding CsgD family transcriptional regulator